MEQTLKAAIPIVSKIIDALLVEHNYAIVSNLHHIEDHSKVILGRIGKYGENNYLIAPCGMRQNVFSPWPYEDAPWACRVEYEILDVRNTGTVNVLDMDVYLGKDEFYRDMILAKMIA